MMEDADLFDFSGYDNTHSCFTGMDIAAVHALKARNKKIIGKMKDVMDGYAMDEFVGLRAKVYSFTVQPDQRAVFDAKRKSSKKLKGIKKCVVQHDIHHAHYRDCLFKGERIAARMNTFQSVRHRIRTIGQVKMALSNYDDKRYLLDDGVSTLAHGHYRITTGMVEET